MAVLRCRFQVTWNRALTLSWPMVHRVPTDRKPTMPWEAVPSVSSSSTMIHTDLNNHIVCSQTDNSCHSLSTKTKEWSYTSTWTQTTYRLLRSRSSTRRKKPQRQRWSCGCLPSTNLPTNSWPSGMRHSKKFLVWQAESNGNPATSSTVASITVWIHRGAVMTPWRHRNPVPVVANSVLLQKVQCEIMKSLRHRTLSLWRI